MGLRKGRRWNSCLVWFLTSVGALCLTVSCIGASDETAGENVAWFARSEGANTNARRSNPSSTKTTDEVNVDRLMLVSTLDGRLSALDVKEEGKLLWSVQADTRPLLSSSISKLEIMHDGVPTRYIPSLDGGLYRYDGESIEAVPMTAETLLSSSFKLADDTVMIGGKDLLTYGINPQNGQVRYACGVKGCVSFGDAVDKEEDVIVLTRNTQTVRAVDARSGSEKWNFSVGQHEIQFMKGQRQVITDHSRCEDDEDGVVTCSEEIIEEKEDITEGLNNFSNSIKIVVPEGMVVGVNPDNMQSVTWQYKFKSPVSNAWLLYKGELLAVDMFDNQNIPALSSFEQEERPQQPPLLYVGMHQQQLYVQPSSEMQDRMEEAADRYTHAKVQADVSHIPRVAWKPYLNTAQFRTPSMRNRPAISHVPKKDGGKDQCIEDEEHALIIWHENYPFDNGFYLYPEFSVPLPLPDPEKDPTEANQSNSFEMLEDLLPVTLWNWWKEVMAISILTSVIVNLIISHFLKHRNVVRQDSSGTQSAVSSSEGTLLAESQEANAVTEDNKTPSRQNSDESKSEYVSRYAADFEHIQTLGKGGFGIVFESKNKVDECHYAVKRIALPNSADAREKVMREVKALANLDHMGIVRYFHAWIESPPPGWQEERDREIEDSECLSTPTPCNTVSQQGTVPFTSGTQNFPYGSCKKNTLGSSQKQSGSPNPKSLMELLQNPFGGNGLDLSMSDAKKGGSEEFSFANSNSNWEEEEESGSFSCGVGTPNFSTFTMDDSLDIEFRLSDSKIGSDNTNNNCDKKSQNIPFSEKNPELGNNHVSLEVNSDSWQNVFEDSGCGEKSSKESSNTDVCSGTPKSPGISSESHDLLSISSNPHSKTHSRTHSRSLSKDLAKLTIGKEGNCEKSDKKLSGNQNKSKNDNRTLPGPKLYVFIQMQLCKRETLKDWLNANTLNRDRHMVLDMFDQIVCAVEYVHERGLMHRDLKPSNIFFSLDGVIKMGDFGLATALPQEQNEASYGPENHPFRKHTAQVGTQLYMSPEQTAGKVYSQKVDIFSLGVILFELLYPFATQMERVSTLLGVKVQKFPERFTREMPKECEIVKLLLSPCPEDRPAARVLLECELLKEFENRRMPRRFRTRTISQNSS